MNKRHRLMISALFAFAAWGFSQASCGREDSFEFGRFGKIHVVIPEGKITSVAIFAADTPEWSGGAKALANALASTGALVAGIDTAAYVKSAQASDEYCTYPAGELEDLAHGVEKRYAVPNYLSPILVGEGQGADLLYSALAQAPAGTFRALLTMGFCPSFDLQHRICDGRALKSIAKEKTATQLVPVNLGAPWINLVETQGQRCPNDAVAAFIAKSAGARSIIVPHATEQRQVDVLQLQIQYRQLAIEEAAKPLPAKVNDLPLVEVPATKTNEQHKDLFAIIITGDGGWAGLDREVAAGLADAGIPVVGLSSLKYFWHLRTAEETARDLQRLVNYYANAWHRDRVLLVGYSFGADVMPAVVNRLSSDVRGKIQSINLLGLGHHASFEIHVTAWVKDSAEGPLIKPEIDKIKDLPITCIRGDDESDSLCNELSGSNVRTIVLPGGHHFNGDYAAVVGKMLDERKGK